MDYTQIGTRSVGDSRIDLMKKVAAFTFGGIFITLIIGMFIRKNFDWYVEILYWIMIFGVLIVLFWFIVLPKLRQSGKKIINAEYKVK